ncbi:SMP-30/gluconolactonase/LRE family protein [Pontibacter chitinilyticus]|uniref:SMP-30/gluconolactonase/LRE family protein n=1 Tax=Pontibacter chitinilyticus TaxID=2674989 RepID=UPI00321A52EF
MALLYSCTNGLFGSKAPVKLQQAWATDNVLRAPESALHDPQRDVIYVSTINKASSKDHKDEDSFITKLTPDGKVEELYWVSGLNDPRGLALYNSVLYVADINEVVAIATQTGAILRRYQADKAEKLNDITADNTGNIYVTDTDGKRIYQPHNGRMTTWMTRTAGENPNGIYYDGTRLLLAFKSNGEIKSLNAESSKFSDWTNGIGAADGITKTPDGNYLVSNWEGEVFLVNPEGKKWRVLDTKDQKINAADINYADRLHVLLAPTFNDNRAVAYTVSD